MRQIFVLAATILMVCWFGMGSVSGQEQKAPALPEDPALWINSAPPSPDAFAGKGVVLWFFEEQCPRCEEKWPAMMAISKKFEGKPVLFIAVNSGTPRPSIESYVRDNAISWPVILDPTRSLEPLFNVSEISLQNIYQARIILPDGTWQSASFDLEATAERALTGANWNVDPAQIPRELTAAWQAIEFNNFAGGALAVQKGLKSNKAEVKEAAEQLQEFVEGELEKQLGSAKAALEADRKWEAYKLYKQIVTRFKGYDVPDEVASTLKTLEKDEAVEEEIKALKMLELARKAANGTPAGQKRANGLLEKLREQYPNSEAAAEAGKLSAR